MAPPIRDDDSGLDPVAKPFQTEALVTQFAIETFGGAVLPWLAHSGDTEKLTPSAEVCLPEPLFAVRWYRLRRYRLDGIELVLCRAIDRRPHRPIQAADSNVKCNTLEFNG